MPEIKVNGLDALEKNLKRFPKEITRNLEAAGREAAERDIFPTEGLKNYPPSTSANQPPTPFYIRGRGTQLASRNLGNSERYGTQFYSRSDGLKTILGNRASYAQWLTDEDKQATAMAKIGWRKLRDVIEEKLSDVVDTYQKWVNKTIKELGL